MRVDRAEEPYVILTEYNGNPYIHKKYHTRIGNITLIPGIWQLF